MDFTAVNSPLIDAGVATGQGVGPTHQEIRAHLKDMFDNTEFDASSRNRRFLAYVVEETLQGRAQRIKAYSIAIAAFNRGGDFDPLTDPIVRIEASRLRRSLEHYYLTAGQSSRIRISIPKGSYIPSFSYSEPGNGPVQKPHDISSPSDGIGVSPMPRQIADRAWRFRRWRGAWPVLALVAVVITVVGFGGAEMVKDNARPSAPQLRGPALLVLPFENTSGDDQQSYLARGLTYEIINGLTRFREINVFGAETSFGIAKSRLSELQAELPQHKYVLSGSVKAADGTLQVTALLSDAATGQYVWSASKDMDLSTRSIAEIEAEIANQVVNAIAQPSGILLERSSMEILAKPAESLRSYECVVRFRQYWRFYNESEFEDVRQCLEHTIGQDPNYALGHSSLALLYVDTYRFGFGQSTITFDSLHRARALAERAMALDPRLSDGYLALALVHWFERDTEKSLQIAEQGLSLNPNNAELLADLGLRYAQLARWDRALPLISEAYARDPMAPNGYRVSMSMYAYMQGDFETALTEAKQITTPFVLYGYVMRAASYAQLGDMTSAAEEVDNIRRLAPDYGDRVAQDLAKRNLDPGIVEAVIEGLRKAGLVATETGAG